MARHYADGWGKFRGDETEAKLGVKFSSFQPTWGKYNVIDTDYSHYALIHGCSEFMGNVKEYAWVLTREAVPDSKIDVISKKIFEDKVDGFNYDTTFADGKTEQGATCNYTISAEYKK